MTCLLAQAGRQAGGAGIGWEPVDFVLVIISSVECKRGTVLLWSCWGPCLLALTCRY